MVLQSSVKRIIREIGKEFNLSPQESEEHYIMYIEEYVLKSLYEADFDILRLDALGSITPGLIRTKGYAHSLEKSDKNIDYIKVKMARLIGHMDYLNTTLKRKKLYR